MKVVHITPLAICTALAASLSTIAAELNEPTWESAHSFPQTTAAADNRPNFLFVIVDDQSPFDLKTYNLGSTLETPNIDRLAAEGMVFDAAHHMGAWTGGVCTPSRHMVMSGRTDGRGYRRVDGTPVHADVRRQLDAILARHPGLTADHPYFEQPKAARWLKAYQSSSASEKHLHNHKDYQFYDETLP